MWQEGGMSLGEPGGWCVSTHVNNLLLPCAGGSNERQERSIREDAAGWKRSAAGLARQRRWERKKKRENESREDANAVVILPFSVRLLWGSVESKKRSRLVFHTTHNRRRKKRCASVQILWIPMRRITTDSHHCEYVVFDTGISDFTLPYTFLWNMKTMKTIVFVIDSVHRQCP